MCGLGRAEHLNNIGQLRERVNHEIEELLQLPLCLRNHFCTLIWQVQNCISIFSYHEIFFRIVVCTCFICIHSLLIVFYIYYFTSKGCNFKGSQYVRNHLFVPSRLFFCVEFLFSVYQTRHLFLFLYRIVCFYLDLCVCVNARASRKTKEIMNSVRGWWKIYWKHKTTRHFLLQYFIRK